jgi:hypothetical protein
MAPVLQRAIAVAVGILLGLFFLRQVTLVVGGNPSHVLQIIRIIFGGILLGILFQDFNNLSPAVEASASVKRMHLSLDHQAKSITTSNRRSVRQRWPNLS